MLLVLSSQFEIIIASPNVNHVPEREMVSGRKLLCGASGSRKLVILAAVFFFFNFLPACSQG